MKWISILVPLGTVFANPVTYVHNYVACSIESSSLFASLYIVMLLMHQASRLTIVSCEAKKKQAVRDERVSYLQLAPL